MNGILNDISKMDHQEIENYSIKKKGGESI